MAPIEKASVEKKVLLFIESHPHLAVAIAKGEEDCRKKVEKVLQAMDPNKRDFKAISSESRRIIDFLRNRVPNADLSDVPLPDNVVDIKRALRSARSRLERTDGFIQVEATVFNTGKVLFKDNGTAEPESKSHYIAFGTEEFGIVNAFTDKEGTKGLSRDLKLKIGYNPNTEEVTFRRPRSKEEIVTVSKFKIESKKRSKSDNSYIITGFLISGMPGEFTVDRETSKRLNKSEIIDVNVREEGGDIKIELR